MKMKNLRKITQNSQMGTALHIALLHRAGYRVSEHRETRKRVNYGAALFEHGDSKEQHHADVVTDRYEVLYRVKETPANSRNLVETRPDDGHE
ncbi:membrane protein [Anopheles sinensis]|uniref:Membrane protein n=1 Tax=Anopheles sinensis TaxID=74873 RepID=A0A084VFD9_ANOSI|nr:membrane protein [Anopheles sinensis]